MPTQNRFDGDTPDSMVCGWILTIGWDNPLEFLMFLGRLTTWFFLTFLLNMALSILLFLRYFYFYLTIAGSCGISLIVMSLSQQSRVPIVINSLVLNELACHACGATAQTYYYNISGSWLPVNLSGVSLSFCNAVLEVVAPTQLIISGALTMNQPSVVSSQLRLITQPTNTTLTPYVKFFITSLFRERERLLIFLLYLKIYFRGEL